MEKISRQRRNESEWRELVDRQVRSGLAVPVFSHQEGISSASLYGWRSRLSRGAKGESTHGKASRIEDASAGSSAEFIDLGSVGSGRSRFEVRLDLGQGVLLHLVRG